MDAEERLELLKRYESCLEAIQIALFRIGDHGLDEAPEGEWTPRQIVHHMADAELFRAARLRLILAGDESELPSFDDQEFAGNLDYTRPIEGSIALVRAVIASNIELLRGLPEPSWHLTGNHRQLGRITVEDWLARAANHGYEHAGQLESNAAWHAAGVH